MDLVKFSKMLFQRTRIYFETQCKLAFIALFIFLHYNFLGELVACTKLRDKKQNKRKNDALIALIVIKYNKISD